MVTVGAGALTMSRKFRVAFSRISQPVDGEALASSWTVTVTPWTREGELTLKIRDFAIVLLGTTARSRCPVSTWIAHQFILLTLPSVPPSRLIQSPGTSGRLRLRTMPEDT
jgi:hypothetical protein